MRMVAFKGATCYEAQLGCVYVRILRPRFWKWDPFQVIVTFGIDRT